MRSLIIISALVLLSACTEKFVPADYISLNDKYDVVIERDHLGVPHIMGERDIDTALVPR